jgi:hypothetical protein
LQGRRKGGKKYERLKLGMNEERSTLLLASPPTTQMWTLIFLFGGDANKSIKALKNRGVEYK